MLLKTFARVQVKSPVPKTSEATALRIMGACGEEGGDLPRRGMRRRRSGSWAMRTKDHFGTYMLLEKPGKGRSNAPFMMGMTGFNGYPEHPLPHQHGQLAQHGSCSISRTCGPSPRWRW